MNELDGRYSTAEEAIIDSFFLLVREKDYDKITVADVVKKSGIVRSTFYNHYENVDELISAVEEYFGRSTVKDVIFYCNEELLQLNISGSQVIIFMVFSCLFQDSCPLNIRNFFYPGCIDRFRHFYQA